MISPSSPLHFNIVMMIMMIMIIIYMITATPLLLNLHCVPGVQPAEYLPAEAAVVAPLAQSEDKSASGVHTSFGLPVGKPGGAVYRDAPRLRLHMILRPNHN